MAEYKKVHPFIRTLRLLKLDKRDISALYFYAILAGIIQLSLPLGVQSIINFVTFNSVSTSLIVLIALVIVGVFLGGFLQINQMQLSEKIQQKIFVRYAFAFAETIPTIELKATENVYLPEITNRFFDTLNLQKGLSKLLLDIPMASIQILFGIVLLSFYHPVFIAIGALLLLIVYLIIRLSSEKGLETSLEESEYKYKVAAWLQDISRHLNTFKISDHSQLNIKKTDIYTQGYLLNRTKHFKILKIQYWALIAFKVILTAAMLIIGCVLLVNQLINIGQFIAAEIVILSIITSIEKMIKSIDVVFDVLTAVEKLNKVLQKETEKNGNIVLSNTQALAIQFNNVSFAYTPHHQVFTNLSFGVDSGKKFLIKSSSSGAGASTILKVLSHTHSPTAGKVLINDIPTDNYDLKSLRNQISYLNGQGEIFQGTLWENITISNPTISAEKLSQLIKELGFDNFLENFDEGYNTLLFTKGRKLPSQVIQEILLLRTFIQPCQLFILDEPYKNLSAEMQQKVANYIQKLPQTVVLASQIAINESYYDNIIEI